MKKTLLFGLLACLISLTVFGACNKASDVKSDDSKPAADAKADNPKAADAKADAKKDEAPQNGPAAIKGQWAHDTYVYTFNEDGSGTYDASGTLMKFKFTAENGKLSITYEGNTEPLVLDYELKGDVLNVKDSFGKDTLYNRK